MRGRRAYDSNSPGDQGPGHGIFGRLHELPQGRTSPVICTQHNVERHLQALDNMYSIDRLHSIMVGSIYVNAKRMQIIVTAIVIDYKASAPNQE